MWSLESEYLKFKLGFHHIPGKVIYPRWDLISSSVKMITWPLRVWEGWGEETTSIFSHVLWLPPVMSFTSLSRIIFGQDPQDSGSIPFSPSLSSPQVQYLQTILYSLLHARQLQSYLQGLCFSHSFPLFRGCCLGRSASQCCPDGELPWITYFPTFRSMCFSVFCSVTEVNKLCWTHGALSGGQEHLQVL